MKSHSVKTRSEPQALTGFTALDVEELNRCITWFEEALIAMADPEQYTAHKEFYLSEMMLVAADARAQLTALTTQFHTKTSNTEPG